MQNSTLGIILALTFYAIGYVYRNSDMALLGNVLIVSACYAMILEYSKELKEKNNGQIWQDC